MPDTPVFTSLYTITTDRDGRQSITCHTCGRTSYHPEDVRQRYCGYCHVFHDDQRVSP
jgi:ribosomal protein L37E